MDQANALRGKVRQKKVEQLNFSKIIPENANSKLIAVSSGKGGVGKTNFALNLAISMLKQNKKVIIIDSDFGLANIEVLLGLSPRYTLLDVFSGDKNIEEIIVDGPVGLKFISGGSGLSHLSNIGSKQLSYIISNLAYLDRFFDYILIDTGAGISPSVISFVRACEDIIVVTTPEPTSITDAYSLIKTSVEDYDYVGEMNFKLVINRAENEDESLDIFNKLGKVTEKFLGTKISYLGFIPDDSSLVKAVKQQEPLSILYPNSSSAHAIEKIGFSIMNIETADNDGLGILRFVKKMMGIFNG